MLDAGLPPMVLDGEIAVPDERGVTHLDPLSDAISEGRPGRLAYFAFDLLHLDGHDLRRSAIEDRKTLLRDVIGAAGCERIVYVDHVLGIGKELFEAVRQIGAEGIVSKRRGSQPGRTHHEPCPAWPR
jgi:bifunctional non-homologous end joining protein LigD